MIIHLKDKVFEIAVNLSLKGAYFKKIKLAGEAPDVRVLLIMSDDSVLGEEKNAQFWRNTTKARDGDMQTLREENALAQYIQLMCDFEKIVVSAVRGSVVGAFLGAIFSTDFRIASENTLFSFPCMRYNLPPQGAIAYFLPRYVGIAKAKNILLRAEAISASQAMELSLVDQVVPNSDFEAACVEFANQLTSLPPHVVGMTKRLMGCDLKELNFYLGSEAKFVGLHKVKLPPDEDCT